MLQNNLIKKCTCGNTDKFTSGHANGIDYLQCDVCSIIHQIVWMSEREYLEFYTNQYHSEHQTRIGCQPYIDRYKHDTEIAKLRINSYRNTLEPNLLSEHPILDIGSGNGAFVDACVDEGINAYGLEPNPNMGNPTRTYVGTLLTYEPIHKYAMISMHDVFEHVTDPNKYLETIHSKLIENGTLIVDFPNFFVDAGKHHWRPIQHIWYFTLDQLQDLLLQHNFKVYKVEYPIPSKFVLYARKNSIIQ